MELFAANPDANLLPCDGEAFYHGPIMEQRVAREFEQELRTTIAWRTDEVIMFGKRIETSRKVAWYGDEGLVYIYSGTKKVALAWTETLLRLRRMVEPLAGEIFNSCLLNLYHHGKEGMSWHSDGEKALVENGCIASLSLGAERRFDFKHKRDPERKVSLMLEEGSLLIMKGVTQKYWLHRLPPDGKVSAPRINLTFRMISVKPDAR